MYKAMLMGAPVIIPVCLSVFTIWGALMLYEAYKERKKRKYLEMEALIERMFRALENKQ